MESGSEVVSAPEGGMICSAVDPKEYNGEVDDGLDDEDDTGIEEEPKTGLFGREAGSVLSQDFIASRNNTANP